LSEKEFNHSIRPIDFNRRISNEPTISNEAEEENSELSNRDKKSQHTMA
jgi:hypothetical protein